MDLSEGVAGASLSDVKGQFEPSVLAQKSAPAALGDIVALSFFHFIKGLLTCSINSNELS